MRYGLAVLLLIGGAWPAIAQVGDPGETRTIPAATEPLRDFSPDRPGETESPYTVDAGHFQIELEFANYTTTRDGGVRTRTFGAAPVNLKLGLTDRSDLQLIVEPYARRTATDLVTGVRERAEGFGNVTLRYKRNLFGNDGGPAALALMPFVTLPTAGEGLGVDAVEFGLLVPFALALTDGMDLGLMTEVDMRRDEDGHGYSPSFVNSATLGFDLTDRLGMYTELFTERSTDRGARWAVTGDVGFTYALSPNDQLDAGINVGLTDAADDAAVFAGYSRRFR